MRIITSTSRAGVVQCPASCPNPESLGLCEKDETYIYITMKESTKEPHYLRERYNMQVWSWHEKRRKGYLDCGFQCVTWQALQVASLWLICHANDAPVAIVLETKCAATTDLRCAHVGDSLAEMPHDSQELPRSSQRQEAANPSVRGPANHRIHLGP